MQQYKVNQCKNVQVDFGMPRQKSIMKSNGGNESCQNNGSIQTSPFLLLKYFSHL